MAIRDLINTTFSCTETFFSQVRNKLIDSNDSQKRIHVPYVVEDILTGQLATLEKELREYIKYQDDKNYKMEMETQILRCSEYKRAVFEFLSMNIEESVFWLELENSRSNTSYSLNYSPLNIAEKLNKHLFSTDIPVIITSANTGCRKEFKFLC